MPLGPKQSPLDQPIGIAELLAAAQLQSGDRQRLAGAPEQFQSRAVLEVEFALDRSPPLQCPRSAIRSRSG